MAVELTEQFLAQIAGWEPMKTARNWVAENRVLSSSWAPPLLKGIVQEGATSYRAGLVLKGSADIENICGCRASRERGIICAHSVAVGLHHLRPVQSPAAAPIPSQPQLNKTAPPTPSPPMPLLRRVEPGLGQAVRLHIIFPPNFTEAAIRGRMTFCIEVESSGRKLPLAALPADRGYCFPAEDHCVLDWVEARGATVAPMIPVRSSELSEALAILAEHPRITIGRTRPVQVTKDPWTPKLKAELLESGEIQLRPVDDLSKAIVLGENWVWREPILQPVDLPPHWSALASGPLKLSRPEVPSFLMLDYPKLIDRDALQANFQPEDFLLEPQPPKFRMQLKGGLARLEAVLQCCYGERVVSPDLSGISGRERSSADQALFWMADPVCPVRYVGRDLPAEQQALARLLRAGFTPSGSSGTLSLLGENAVLSFFARVYPHLKREWEVSLEPRLERTTSHSLESIEPRCEFVSSGTQWLDFSVCYASEGGERLSVADIQRLLLTNQPYTRLKNGKWALLDTWAVEELQEVLRDCSPQQHGKGYRLNERHSAYLQSTIREQGWRLAMAAPQGQTLTGGLGPAQWDVGDLQAVLRHYQATGVNWLGWLRSHGFGGILADEMGLGKTLQALALFRAERRPSSAEGPALVVCPTSLVWNWVAEARKFTPELKILALHGSDRQARFGQVPSSDIVVTSYALLRRDLEFYKEFQFDTVLLDEAQHIKNRQTQNAQAVKALRTHHRLVLTGTPMENSVLDLWSIFDFLMPGYLGSAAEFRDRYEIPLTRSNSPEIQARLARRVRPFILRRLKRDVAAELPARLEQVSFCELTRNQRAIYDEILQASRREVLSMAGQAGIGRARMLVLKALLRLRQACCDPRLLGVQPVDPEEPSGKVALFEELLDEVLDGGHRVLVFSQFVSMLALLRQRLEQSDVPFCYLDGATRDRKSVVESFQRDSSIPVFLISLKAGGLGLNLTAADTVIHFDPWWNPAVEDQATDRAHRIGQRRVVTSYKLIARATVEEKILALQNRKRERIQATLATQPQWVEQLSWEEVQELLEA